jgi:multisubunit Na+/H+ antiporter MnhE subunit
MSISLLSVNEERSNVIIFTNGLIVTPHIIITTSGMPLEKQIINYLFRIDYTVWMLLFGTIFALNAFYYVQQKVKMRVFSVQIWSYIKILLSQSNLRFGFGSSQWRLKFSHYILGKIRHQLNHYIFLVSLFILIYYLFCLLLSSSIEVELIVNSDKHPIESLEDLAESKNVIPSFDLGSGIQSFFEV